MVCLLCGEPARQANLCTPCLVGLPWNDDACGRCGLPARHLVDDACGACVQRAPPWDALHAPLHYAFPADVLVRLLKFRRQLAAGRALARAMRAGLGGEAAAALSASAPRLVPVPLHWRRLAWRGFNQARELALHLARDLALPLDDRHLVRRRSTPAQAGLDAARRRRNLRGAFRWRGASLAGANVILVDDVLTTGATAQACVRALKSAGAGRVAVWVAARTPLDRT